MTPEQIKERCVDVMYELKEMIISEESSNEYLYEQRLAKLESLYREAMAKGLEMAVAKIDERVAHYLCTRDVDRLTRDIQMNEAYGIRDACRKQVNTLKETTCDTSS